MPTVQVDDRHLRRPGAEAHLDLVNVGAHVVLDPEVHATGRRVHDDRARDGARLLVHLDHLVGDVVVPQDRLGHRLAVGEQRDRLAAAVLALARRHEGEDLKQVKPRLLRGAAQLLGRFRDEPVERADVGRGDRDARRGPVGVAVLIPKPEQVAQRAEVRMRALANALVRLVEDDHWHRRPLARLQVVVDLGDIVRHAVVLGARAEADGDAAGAHDGLDAVLDAAALEPLALEHLDRLEVERLGLFRQLDGALAAAATAVSVPRTVVPLAVVAVGLTRPVDRRLGLDGGIERLGPSLEDGDEHAAAAVSAAQRVVDGLHDQAHERLDARLAALHVAVDQREVHLLGAAQALLHVGPVAPAR